MNKDEASRGIDLLLKDTGDKERELRRVFASLIQELEATSSNTDTFPALDRKVGLEWAGGYAFLWGDIIDLGNIADALLQSGPPLSPNQLAKVVIALLQSWQKLRKVRVEIDEDEFKVMLAIKRGNKDITSIARFTELNASRVNEIVNSLKCRQYNESLNLVEVSSSGDFSTQF